jgi:hypothetical protein
MAPNHLIACSWAAYVVATWHTFLACGRLGAASRPDTSLQIRRTSPCLPHATAGHWSPLLHCSACTHVLATMPALTATQPHLALTQARLLRDSPCIWSAPPPPQHHLAVGKPHAVLHCRGSLLSWRALRPSVPCSLSCVTAHPSPSPSHAGSADARSDLAVGHRRYATTVHDELLSPSLFSFIGASFRPRSYPACTPGLGEHCHEDLAHR